ncbi:unnamed protein product [Closterium sp. NIES-53]
MTVRLADSIEAAALSASESALPGTALAEALHTFTLDSGASRCFFCDSTTLTPLSAPVLVRLADPLRGLVLAHSSTVLLCPAVLSGSLSGLHLPLFSTNLTLLWHHRLGHPSLPCLRGMHSRLLVSGLPRSLPPLPPSPAPPCFPCVEGRQRAAPHSSSFPPTTAPLKTLHMDVWGPARVSGQGRERYFLLVVDDYTLCLQLRERIHQDLPVLRLHSDRGENWIAERRIGLVMEPRVSLPETSPTLRWTREVGDASVLWVWGSCAFVHNTSVDKLSARAIPCVFLGFPPDAPGWQFYHPTSRRVFPSQDVTFDESVPFYRLFPYHSAPHPPPPLFLAPGPPPIDPLPPQGPAPSGVSQVDPLPRTVPVEVAVASGAVRGAASGGAASGGAEPGSAESEGAGSGGAEPGGAEPGGAEPPGVEPGGAKPEGVEPGGAEFQGAESGGAEPRAAGAGDSPAGETGAGVVGATRLGGAGVTVRAGGTGGAAAPGGAPTRESGAAGTGSVGGDLPGPLALEELELETLRRSHKHRELESRPALPVRAVCPGRRVSRPRPPLVPGTHAMAVRPSSVPLRVPLLPPPKSSLPAVLDPELDLAHAASPTLVDFAAACRLDYATAFVAEFASASPPSIGGECVLGTDVLEDWVKRPPGSLPAFKAGYVTRGFSQRQGVDYFQTFSPMPKMTTLRGSLHEEIWLRRPPGFTGSFPAGTQWSLRRPVYGLRQAPREWHDTLRTTLAALGFTPLTADLSLFLRTDTSLPPFYVLLYPTPLSSDHSLSAPPSDESVEPSGPYPELVGCLMCLMTCTRPDLAYPLSLFARHVAPGRHRKVHRDAAKRVLRYLCITLGMGLVLGGQGPVLLSGHADASWVDDLAMQRSSQGYTFNLCSGSVSWRSTRSSSVLSSSCEVEIYAVAMVAQELCWLTYLLTDLGEQPRLPPVLYVDNKAMIALCQECYSLEST